MLPDVDVFASSSPDEIVLVNTSRATLRVTVHAQGSNPQAAAVWQLHQTGVKPSPPAKIGTAASLDGVFKITLPGHSVTTLVMTTEVSNRK